jgi:hypothetical protein
LTVLSFHEAFDTILAAWDAWESGVSKRKQKVYGVRRAFTLRCVEKDVAWSNCQAKNFQDTATAGTAVSFAITDQIRVISTSVYITQVTIDAEDIAGKNIRRFSVMLQEA